MKQLYILPMIFSLAACTTTVVDEPDADASVPIGFSSQAETRAIVTENNLPDGSFFKVWGGHSGNNVFQGREVQKTASGCTYQGTEYWVAGETYHFYAIYPADLTGVEVTDDGSVAITGFDCSRTDDGAVDLMTASTTDVSADGMIANSGSVSLKFQHLLSLLTFSFKNQLTSHAIDITNLRLSVVARGDYQSSSSPSWVNLASDKTAFTIHPADNPLQVDKEASASTSLLVIPQSNADVTVTFTVNIRENYDTGGSLVYSKRYTASLATGDSAGNAWKTGYRYNYTATIPATIMEGEEITLTVSVKDWDEENAHVSWGGKDEDSSNP